MYLCMYVWMDACMYGLIFLTHGTYLGPQKLVIFEHELCPINH